MNWSPIKDACIKGNNYKYFTGVVTIDICKENCILELGSKCNSIEYRPGDEYCFISEARSTSDDYTEPCYSGIGRIHYTEMIINTGELYIYYNYVDLIFECIMLI